METPPPESSNTTIRPDLLIRVKRGSIGRTIADALTALPTRFRRRRASQLPSPSSPSNPRPALSKMISNITLQDIHGAKHLGGGGFGTIRIFEHPTQGKVALKQLRVSGGQLSNDLRRRTMREGETWQDLKHPWVLPFLGVLETPTDLYLVSPYVKNGALDDFLRQNPHVDRSNILWKTSGAITYLHEHGIIHGDIKAANILVSDNVEPLLCDFGLAKFEDGVTSAGLEGVGTVRFQSPEVLMEGGGKSFASDVWAFGMTIFEVLSGKLPFSQYTIPTAIISAIVLRDERPPTSPSHSPSGASYDRNWTVAKRCWQKDPAKRASMHGIYHRLRPDKLELRGHTLDITSQAISPDGMTIASGGFDRALRLWDVKSGVQQGEPLEGHTRTIASLAFSPDGMTLVSGSRGRAIRLWDVASGSQRSELEVEYAPEVTCLAFSPDGMTIVAGCSGLMYYPLRLFDVASGSQRGAPLAGHTAGVSCVAISPDGMTIVSGSMDNTLRLWDLASGSQRGPPLEGHRSSITCVAISPDGMTIVSGSYDHTLRLWDLASGSQRGLPLEGHTNRIDCLAILPDGITMVSASGYPECALRVWEVASGSQLGGALRIPIHGIKTMAMSPDGNLTMTGIAYTDASLQMRDELSEELMGPTAWVTYMVNQPDGMPIASGFGDDIP